MRKIRLLCLHDYHGSGEILRTQLRRLVCDVESLVDFCYVDAPSLARGDFGWWHLNVRGWEQTRAWAIDLFGREPHFDGVFGFGQGAALAALLVGLRAPNGRVSDRKPLSFEFAMLASGFRSDSPVHAGLFADQDSFALPSLHLMSRSDPTVAVADSRILAAEFDAPTVVEHSGGHVIASTPPVRENVARFLAKMANHPSYLRHIRSTPSTRESANWIDDQVASRGGQPRRSPVPALLVGEASRS